MKYFSYTLVLLTIFIGIGAGCAPKTAQEKAISFVKKNPSYCEGEFRSIPQYEQADTIGSIITAYHCSPERLSQHPQIQEGSYTGGSIIWLSENPSTALLTTIKTIGYVCSGGSEGNCKKWRLDTTVTIDSFVSIEPFIYEVADDACPLCTKPQ